MTEEQEWEWDVITFEYLRALDDGGSPTLAELCAQYPHRAKDLIDFAMTDWQIQEREKDPVFQAEFTAWWAENGERSVAKGQETVRRLVGEAFEKMKQQDKHDGQ